MLQDAHLKTVIFKNHSNSRVHHVSSLCSWTLSRMKWRQKRSSIKALCYFYKPTEVNPREIMSISVQTTNPGRKRRAGWLPNTNQTVLLKSVGQNPVSIQRSLNWGGRTKCKGQTVVRAPRAVELVCLFNAHKVKTHMRAHTHIYCKDWAHTSLRIIRIMRENK